MSHGKLDDKWSPAVSLSQTLRWLPKSCEVNKDNNPRIRLGPWSFQSFGSHRRSIVAGVSTNHRGGRFSSALGLEMH